MLVEEVLLVVRGDDEVVETEEEDVAEEAEVEVIGAVAEEDDVEVLVTGVCELVVGIEVLVVVVEETALRVAR
jgi:hypothetical protein